MYKLGDKSIDNCGNKAKLLSMLKSRGYNIPLGIVIDFEEFKNIIKTQNLSFENIDEIVIPDELINKIFNVIPHDKTYAIRSSVKIEDVRNLSLSGKYNTYLNVALDRENFKDKIKSCFLSMYSTDNLQFYRKNKIDISKIEMNIIIQEMIESNASGILFTVNPINGKDTQIVIEFSMGTSESISRNIELQRIVYDWMEEKYIETSKINILGDSSIRKIINISLTLQQELGLPVDVEFGVYDSKLYIFQVHPITKIQNKEIYYRYVNTDNQIVSRFISSITEKVTDSVYENLIDNLKLPIRLEEVKPITILKYSRIYWNLTLLKKIVENIPGYVERNLDESLNVMIDYLDNGKSNFETSKKKFKMISKKNIVDILKRQSLDIEDTRKEYLEKISMLNANQSKVENEDELKENILKAITYYYEIRISCQWQKFINFMLKINLNENLENILNRNEISNLFIGVSNEYLNGPLLYMWDVSRKIRKDEDRMKFFEKNLDAEIYYLYRKEPENVYIKDFLTDFFEKYGYHSFNEKDIIYKTYEEEVLKVIKMFRDILDTEDNYDPLKELKQQNKLYEKSMEKITSTFKKSQLKNILKDIEYIREKIRDVYEITDLEILIQSILRKYLISLGKIYKSRYVIDDEEDIFYLEYTQILNEKEENIKSIINKNKIYFNSFRNYQPIQDIFPTDKPQINLETSKILEGVGASFGKAKGRAFLVKEKEDLKKLKSTDIMLVKYLDADMFKNIEFKEVSGIVTEYSGILSNLAIIARENGIPCVVDLKEAIDNINTGDIIQINGENGQVIIENKN